MIGRLVIALLATVLAATPASAMGGSVEGAGFVQSSVFSMLPPAGARDVQESMASVSMRGALTVSFHSDAATGCAALAGCAYAGTMVYKPSSGQLLALSYRLDRRRQLQGVIFLGSFGPTPTDEVYARVTRTTPGGGPAVCADATQAGGFVSSHRVGSRLVFDLATALAPTRCAGPLAGDLARALPVLSLGMPLHAPVHADLRATRSFAAHGFAGTVTSTLQITVGRSSAQSTSGPGQRVRTRRFREVQRAVKVVSERGSFTFDVRGTSQAQVCILLDSCGLTGQLTLTPGLLGVRGSLSVLGPTSRRKSDFVGALSGRHVRGLGVIDGSLNWGRAGTFAASLHQVAACTDTASAGAGSLSLAVSSGRMRAHYGVSGGGLFGGGLPRLRCPGPTGSGSLFLASGSTAWHRLNGQTFTITLGAGPAFRDDGYVVAPRGQVTLTLRLGRVSERVFAIPTGP